MGSGYLLSIGRALALISMVFALVGIAVTMSGYATEGFSLENAEVTTHTKAFCSPKEGLLYCEDKLIIETETSKSIPYYSPVTGAAFIDTL